MLRCARVEFRHFFSDNDIDRASAIQPTASMMVEAYYFSSMLPSSMPTTIFSHAPNSDSAAATRGSTLGCSTDWWRCVKPLFA